MTEERRTDNPPEDMIPSLAGGSQASCRYAARILGIDGPEQLCAFLLEAMERGTVPVRQAVSEVVGRLCGTSSQGSLGIDAENLADRSYLTCLLMGVKDPDETTRVNSVGSLASLTDSSEAVNALALALSDPSAPVRARAARSLRHHRLSPEFQSVVPFLVQALGDPDAEVREQAAGALEYVRSPEALVPLVGLLEDESREVKFRAALALGALGAREAVPLLIEILKLDEAESGSAAVCLCRMKAQEALPDLKAALKNSDPYGPQRIVAREIANFGASIAVPALCEALEYGGYRKFRRDAIEALAELGDRSAAPALARALQQWGDPQALTGLLRLGGKEAVEAAIEQVNDGYHEMEAIVAARWLGEEGVTRAMPALRRAVEEAQSRYLVRAAAGALAQLGDTLTGPDMVEWLRDESPDRRRQAVIALPHFRDVGTLEHLMAVLGDPNREVRREAVYSLEWLGDRTAVPALTAALDDIDEEVRRKSRAVLDRWAEKEEAC